ncbi:FAD-dependent oxidoreductase [Aliidongia dinghuensis]|uniref:FAD-dependent oxidoreductase n=1 Tax=Aliidongia dinghuensis TaxID=1867774 RepID=A0A8J2Z046_9PROT|nr:FAD-binding oxidoreductase [Aliidongia dinghuensis]GGF43098.1 FAD-dependent oxidoreductase [Aliidongia dinghuensis]
MPAVDFRAEDFLGRIQAVVGERYVVTDASEIDHFATDHRGRYHGTALAIVRPGSTAEVSGVVKLCAEHGVAVTPQGGNTGLCGGATPLTNRPSILMRLDRLNRVREVSPIDDTITVEAGCVLADIQAAAAGVDRLFPLSLGAEGSCQIGGNISTNAGGIAVLRYGAMRSLVLGLEVVLADGSVFNGLRRLRKDNAGYDLKQLFIGAEGTLGIVTAAALKLSPAIKSRTVAMVQMASVEDALTLFERTRKTFGERISSFEIIGSSYMDFVLKYVANTSMPFEQKADWYVLIEAGEANTGADLAGAMEELLGPALEGGLVSDAIIAGSLAQEEALWRLRHGVTGEFKVAGKTMSHDTSVPVSCQPEFTQAVEKGVLEAYPDANVMMVGHIGDGNIHVVVLFPHERFADAAAFDAAADEIDAIIDDIAIGLGGSITAEHGVGTSYRKRMARTKDPFELALMRRVKAALDPDGLMNPEKIFLPTAH